MKHGNIKQLGLAKAQFYETYQRTPWNTKKFQLAGKIDEWPLLEKQLNQKRISYFDYLLTRRLLRDHPQATQETALFICHLILAAKEGHLCIEIKNNQLSPSIYQLWSGESELPLSDDEADLILKLILKGSTSIPGSLITFSDNSLQKIWPSTPICSYQNSFYLQRHWILESLFLQHLAKQIQTEPSIKIEPDQLKHDLSMMVEKGELNQEQSQALFHACSHSLCLITGGPGTGKTYTAGQLIRVFWNHLTPEEQSNSQIILAAPTGKAAANLQKSLGKAVADLQGFPNLQARTLHALLNLNRSSSNSSSIRLTADLIVVDESSMIDIKVMGRLLESMKAGSRLVLLGDPHQLPSVEAGSLFVDLNHLSHSAASIAGTHLKTCLRAELKSMIAFAHLVNHGEADQAIAALNQSTPGLSRLHFDPDPKKAQKELIAYYVQWLPSLIKPHEDAHSLIEAFNAIRLLSPMRKGPFGVDILNQLIWQLICQNSPSGGSLAIPILIVSNDYRQDLYNGETGLLIRKLPLKNDAAEDYALFPCRNHEGQMRRFSTLQLPKYELAYCLSVHKSQGSEFERIILALPEGAERFGREIFYTAITRARRQIEIYGSDSTIQKTISRHETRLSGVQNRYSSV
ncbi:MAG: exodeoxyribonuclease V subunit alpha [Chlamydiales bacterium]